MEPSASQLKPPRIPAGAVRRTTLVAAIDAAFTGAHACSCLILNAPAGYGKTTLAAQWLATTPLDAAWLTLDAGDDSPARLAACIAAALMQLDARPIGENPDADAADPEGLLDSLLSAADRLTRRSVLIIDGYERLGSPGAQALMARFVASLPARLHLLVLACDMPAFRDDVLSAGTYEVFGTDELALTDAEADRLARNLAPDALLDAASWSRAKKLAGGWAAAAALALNRFGRTGTPPDQALERETEPGGVLDGFFGDLYAHEPAPVRAVLLRASLFDSFGDALVGCTVDPPMTARSAAAVINHLAAHALFVREEPYRDGRCFSLHPLFRRVLRGIAEDELGPAGVSAAYRAASLWYEGRGRPNDAMACAEKSGDPVFAAERLDAAAEALLATIPQTDGFDLLTWQARVPAGQLRRHPAIRIAVALLRLTTDMQQGGLGLDADRAELTELLADADRADVRLMPRTRGLVALLRLSRMVSRDEPFSRKPMERWIDEARAGLGEDDPLGCFVELDRYVYAALYGSRAELLGSLEHTRRVAIVAGNATIEAVADLGEQQAGWMTAHGAQTPGGALERRRRDAGEDRAGTARGAGVGGDTELGGDTRLAVGVEAHGGAEAFLSQVDRCRALADRGLVDEAARGLRTLLGDEARGAGGAYRPAQRPKTAHLRDQTLFDLAWCFLMTGNTRGARDCAAAIEDARIHRAVQAACDALDPAAGASARRGAALWLAGIGQPDRFWTPTVTTGLPRELVLRCDLAAGLAVYAATGTAQGWDRALERLARRCEEIGFLSILTSLRLAQALAAVRIERAGGAAGAKGAGSAGGAADAWADSGTVATDGLATGLFEQALMLSASSGSMGGFLALAPLWDAPLRAVEANLGAEARDQAAFVRQVCQQVRLVAEHGARPGAGKRATLLTDREIEVLALVADGRTNQEIAERLGVELTTVKTHMYRIFGRIGVKNRTEAAAFARKMGLA